MDEQAKLSRRSILRGAVLLAGGTLAAGVIQIKPAHAQKAGKEAVKYQDSPNNGQVQRLPVFSGAERLRRGRRDDQPERLVLVVHKKS
jgi:hypothetical protein